ncbi:MAG: M14 family zinc carboxypeptidase, partial [Myxococcota bacterium]
HAQIHDADTGAALATLAARDERYASGQIGVTAPQDHQMSPRVRLAMLSSRVACEQLPELGQVEDPPERFVTLPAALFDNLDRQTSSGLFEVERVGARVTARTDVLGLERLHCAGVALGEVGVEVPWKYLDREYLRYRDLGPVRDGYGGFRADLAPKTPRMVEAMLKALHRAHPAHTRIVEIGRSRRGRKLLAMAIAKDLDPQDKRPAILLNGAHHGDEPSSTDITLDAAAQLLTAQARGDTEATRWMESLVVWVVPQVNPDGALNFLERSRRAGRKNGHDSARDGVEVWERREGVDLNRNYPFRFGSVPEDEGSSPDPLHDHYRGAGPASEPETRAMLRLFEAERFVASISYHSGTVCVLAPYTIPGTADPEPNEAWAVAHELTSKMPRHPEGRPFVLKRSLYPVDGTDQDTFRHRYGTLALLVEAARFSPRTACQRRAVIEANRPSWRLLLRRTLDGPFVYGRVVDASGRPVRAVVRLGEQVLPNGEVWETRARDGAFGRYVKAPGALKLEVTVEGRPVVREVVGVGGTATRVEVVLPFEVERGGIARNQGRPSQTVPRSTPRSPGPRAAETTPAPRH